MVLAVNDFRYVNGRSWDHHHEVRHGERIILCMICPCKVIMPVPRLTAQIECPDWNMIYRVCAQIKDSSSIIFKGTQVTWILYKVHSLWTQSITSVLLWMNIKMHFSWDVKGSINNTYQAVLLYTSHVTWWPSFENNLWMLCLLKDFAFG